MEKKLRDSMEKYYNTDFWVGAFWMASGWVLSFITPVYPFVLVAVLLTMADLYAGIKAARYRGEKIHSRGLRRSVEKITLYVIAILCCENVRLTFFPSVNITYVAAFAICLTELQSLVENVETVTGVNIWSRIKKSIWHHLPDNKK